MGLRALTDSRLFQNYSACSRLFQNKRPVYTVDIYGNVDARSQKISKYLCFSTSNNLQQIN